MGTIIIEKSQELRPEVYCLKCGVSADIDKVVYDDGDADFFCTQCGRPLAHVRDGKPYIHEQ